MGDIENWSKAVEKDMQLISTALEYAYKVECDSHLSAIEKSDS